MNVSVFLDRPRSHRSVAGGRAGWRGGGHCVLLPTPSGACLTLNTVVALGCMAGCLAARRRFWRNNLGAEEEEEEEEEE